MSVVVREIPSPRSARFVAVGLALALVLGGMRDVIAQTPPTVRFQGTPDETEAYREYTDNHLLTARTRAAEVLRRNPDSIVGNYVMGCVYREAEGDLPRAMSYLGHARELYEARYGTARPPGAPWQLHREILFAIQALAGEMEEYAYQVQVLEFHDYLYDPDLLGEHAWPLLHLGRFDEARSFARRAIASSDPWQQSLGRNALCAIEGAARQRQAAYTACLDAFENARHRAVGNMDTNPATAPHVAVHAYNAALAAQGVLRPDEVERLAVEGTRRLEFTTANPWRILVRLYLDEGRATEAVSALREMQRWRIRQPANLRDQDRAETDAAVATVLLVAGERDAGVRFISRALERPDRRGLVASDPEQAMGAHALLRRALERLGAELAAERASWSGITGRAGGIARSMGRGLSAWPDDERVVNVLTDEDRLDSTLRLYVRGGIEPVPSWLVGDLVEVLGAGVVAVALRDVRREERATPALVPYYDGLEAEVALAQDDPDRALRLAQASLARLPSTEALLQARIAAVGAEAARRAGHETVALGLYERAMQRDPGVIRRMGLALPARVSQHGGFETQQRAVTLLDRSPRFRSADAGFQVVVDGNDHTARACLRSAMGALLGCTEVTAERGESADDLGARLVSQFHQEMFATRVGLSTQDLRSLDGSTVTDAAAAREQMNSVLRDISADPDGVHTP